MNPEELTSLYRLIGKEQSGLASEEELSQVISQEGIGVFFNRVKDIFKDVPMLESAFPSLKKNESSESESITLDGSDVVEEQVQEEPTFSWDTEEQPTTVTATKEVQTVPSDPDVGVESKQTLFVKKYYPIIQKEIEKAGLDIDAGALTTQLALESGWGDSSLASKYNNFGGYKSTKDGLKTAPLTTREYFTDKEKEKWEKDPDNTIIEATGRVKGNKKEYKVKTPFKAFATPEEGIAAQIKLISKERYAKHGTTKSGGDPKKYFDAVKKGGYATSPTYAQKNLSLYNSEILPILEDKFKYIADKEERDQFKILEERLQQIDLTGETEETIVPKLNHLLGEYGFKFEQAAIGSDAVKITAPKLDRDGNLIEKVVNFDSLFQKFIGGAVVDEVAFDRDPYEKEIADFVKENRDISIRIEQDKKKIINEKELKQVTEDFNIEAKEYIRLDNLLQEEAAVLTKEADTYKKGVPGYEDYLKRKREHDVKTKDLLSLKENLVAKGKEYDAMVGEYHLMRREGGNFFGQILDMPKRGISGVLGYIADFALTQAGYTHPLLAYLPSEDKEKFIKEIKYGKEEKYVNPFSKVATQESRDTDEGAVEFVEDIGFKIFGRSSTEEYLEDYQQADLFSAKGVGNVFFSVLEFLPAAAAGLAGTIALSAQYVNKEMRDSAEFDDVPEWERMGVSLAIGSVIGALENFGFKNIMQSKVLSGPVSFIATKVLQRNPATMKTFNEYVQQEVKSLMGKGALKILAGGAVEFETGALQEIADISLKSMYNEMKGSDLFETPETTEEIFKQILMGGIAEAMGGMMMATPKAMTYALGTDDLSDIDDKTFNMFKEMSKDPKYLDFVTTKLQQQVVNQEITKDEMKKILTDYNRLNGAMQKMPDGIAPKYQKNLLSLFMQHQKLKDNMKNTDDVFNKEDKKKLAQIENRIDAVLKENKVEKEVDEVLNTPAEESKVFYAEKLEDIPEQHRDKAEKVEDDDTEISFRTNRFGLPIGKVKSTKVGEYYKYTLDGAEIEQTIEENTEEVVEEAQEETKRASNLKSAGQAAAKKWNIEKRKKGKKDPEERTVGNAIGAKVTMNGERGVIKEDPLNPNTIIFESLELEEDISPLQKEVETLSKTVEDIEEGALKQRIQGQLDSKKEELDRRKKRKRKVIEIGNIQEVMLKPLSEFEIKEDREISGRFFSSEEGDFKVVKQSKGKKGELFIVLEDMNFQKKKDSVNERLRKGEITKKEALNEIKELEKNKTKKYTGDKAFDILKKSRERGKKQDPYGYFRDKTPRGTARTVPEKVSVIMGDSTVPKEKYKQYERIVDMAIKAMNALSKALPNVRILLHANSDTFTEETKKKNVRGLFDPKTNIIHINLPKANLRTVGHEVLHAILVNRLKTDKKVGAVVDEMITSIKKAVNPKVAKELEAFTKRYKGKIKNEEYIAELFGILSERANSLSPKAKNIIAEFIQKLRELFNLPSEASVSDQEVVDFLNTLALRVGQGQVIEEEALSLLEDVDKKVTAKKRKQKGDSVQDTIDKLEDQVISDYMNEFNISEEEAMTKYLTEPLPKKYNELKSLMSERDKVESKLEKRYVDLINKSINRLNISPETKNSIKESLFILNDKLQLGVTFDQILSFLSDKKSTQKLFDVIAKNELEAQGLDYDGVMGLDSGWSNKKKKEYKRSVAKKVAQLKNNISKGLTEEADTPTIREQKALPPKIQKLKDEGMLEGIYDFLQAGEMELAEQVLKGAGLTFEEFQDGVFNDLLQKLESKDNKYAEILRNYFDETPEAVDIYLRSFERTDPKTGEPTTVRTDDGYPLARIEGGQYINGDFVFDKFEDFTDDALGFGATELSIEEEAELRGREEFKEQEQELKDNPDAYKREQKGELLAPNGKPSNLTPEQYKAVRTPKFKKWFGDWETDPENSSKVVDENGEPLVVYHGTQKDGINVFDIRIAEEKREKREMERMSSAGFFFTDTFETAKAYSVNDGKFGDIIEVFLDVKNPSYDAQNLQTLNQAYLDFYTEEGFDGGVMPETINGKEYIAFEANQIKLADGSNVTFDPTTPDIRKQKGDNIQEFINELNSQGYTNSEIKQFLIDEMGYTKAEAEALFPKTKTPPVTKKKTKKKTPVKKKSKKKAISQKAKYAQERKEAKSNRTKAKKALPKKFGISKRSFFDSIQKILSVNVDMLPNELLEKYNNVIKNFAVWKKIPRLDLSEVAGMIKETEELLAEIQDVLKNQIEKVRKPKDKKKAAELKEKNIQEILKKKKNINNTLENKYEKALADVLLSVTKAELELMSDENVADLNALLDQIEDGVMSTYYAGKLQVVIEGKIRGGNVLLSKVNMQQFKDFLINGVGRAFSKLKSLITKKVPLHELIRSNLLGSIDNILGNYNAKDIYNKTFGKLETPHEQYTNEMDVISTKLQKFNELISGGKIFKKLTNKQVLSRAKVMASLLQDEYLANSVVKTDSKGNIERDENGNPRMISPKGVASAVSYIDGTIEKLKKGDTVDAEQIKILRELKKEIVKNGKIVITLTKKEQAAKKIIKEINEGLTEKMRYASALRGKKPTIYLDYVHHSAVTTTEEDMMKTQMEMFEVGEKQGRVSTEAGTGYERTDNKAISFDPAFSAYMGAKQTLLDFHMSQPIKEVRASIQALENSTEDSQSDAGTQLMKAFNEALEIVLSRNLNYTGFGRKFANGLRKSAYYAMLASVPRAGAELVTNLDYALISDPVGFTKGATQYFYLSKGMEGAKLMYQAKSAVTSKNYSTEALSGRHAQASILSKTSFDPSQPTGKAKEIYEFIKQNTVAIPFLKTTANTIAEKLIATPDKALARPLWFGRFFSELESLTDRKFSKKEILEMANGDSKLLTTYKKEIELARRKADEANVRMSSSANPFNVRLKDQVRYTGKDAGGFKNTWRVVNTFMTNFIKNENNTVKEGIIALIHSGEISRAEGAALIIAATTRMAGYVVLYTMTKNMFYPLFQPIVDNLFGFGDDDDDKDEKIDWEEMQQLATRQLAGSIAQIFTRGSLGNIPYLPISWGTEEINNQYLSSLRGEDPYDGFKHALVFSMVSLEDIKKKSLYSNLASMTGPASVYLKSLEKTYHAAQMASTAKKQKTRDYYKKYLLSRTIMDIATAFDFLPFYKDIRKMVDDGLWKFKQQNNKKKGMTLTKAQKKKYMPELYKMEEEMDKMYKNTDLYKMQKKMKADQKMMKEQMLKQLYK